MSRWTWKLAVVALSLVWPAWSKGQLAEADAPIRYKHYRVKHELNDDGTSVETRSWAMTVLKAPALDWAKRPSVSYSTSVQSVDVLEAYTLKADGRRVDVPKDNYQLNINKGREAGGPAFSDYSSVSVVFPDLVVGDTVVLAYRVRQAEPVFPGHFDAGEVFSRNVPFDEVRAEVVWPAAARVRYASREMAQEESSPAAGRKSVAWTWRQPVASRNTRKDFSVLDPDKEVGFDFSTFVDHAAIASAYASRALPKAAVTDSVRALAEQIVGARTDRREQARALHDWVSTQITYGGNCVGVGTVVPRDLDVVIANRMGDCKDHATLLQALLAARGIASRQALVNAGAVYTLPKVARVGNVNHVVNYLPEWDLFVDATAKGIPFGTTPWSLRGKPVLLVGEPAGTVRVPAPASAGSQRLVSRLRIADDGSLSGTVEAFYKGDAAVGMREWVRQLPQESRPDMVKEMLQSMGLRGSGRLDLDDATALVDDYHLKLTLDRVDKFLTLPGQGAFHVAPLLGGTSVARFARPDTGERDEFESACTSGRVEEEYLIELPRGIKITSLPPQARHQNSVQRFEASYVLKGRQLQVRRLVDDRTPVAVCPPSILNEYRQFAARVYENLKVQVIYR